MKVGIFGGTLDPFTKAHAAIVRKVLDEKLVDRVSIVPTIVDYYRDKDDRWLDPQEKVRVIQAMLAAEIRTGMVTIDVNEFDQLNSARAGNEGLLRAGRRFVHTLTDLLNGDYAKHELYLIIGSDQYGKFKTWFCWQEILKYVRLIVVNGRGGKFVGIDDDVPVSTIVTIDPDLEHVSATAVRRAYRGTLDRPVERYMLGLPPTKTETKDLLLHTPIFDVVQGPEVKPGFHPVQIKAPDWVTVIAEHKGKFLTVTQVRYGNMRSMREFVCGKVEPGEDPAMAAARELREETGVVPVGKSQLKLIGVVNPNPASYDNRMWFYYVNMDASGFVQEKQDLDEHEEISVSWVGKEEAFDQCRAQPPADKDHDVPAMYMCAAYLYENLTKRNAEGK